MKQKEEIIQLLDLQPHPEGGYFKEVYRSDEEIEASALPNIFEGNRNYATSIYFMLTSDNFSDFHKINQDEIWHFYLGSPIQLIHISPEGKLKEITIGNHLTEGEKLQYVVPKHHWFAAEVMDDDAFALVGCNVSPGFDFKDFTLAKKDDLLKEFPQHESIIKKFTRH